MGCCGSKVDDLPLVVRCRQRRELIRAAANHRYALAAAHVSYFRSLRDVGDALRKFVEEELVTASTSSASSLSSPSLILPPASEVKSKNGDESAHLHDDDESHLNISGFSSDDDGDGDSDDDYKHEHYEHHESDNGKHQNHGHRAHGHKGKGFNGGLKNSHSEEGSSLHHTGGGFYGYGDGLMNDPFMNPFYPPPARSHGEPYMGQRGQQYFSNISNAYYMKKSAPAMKTVVQDPSVRPVYGYSDSYWNSPAGYGGDYGYFPMGRSEGVKVSPRKEAPPPPSPPQVSAWDFFNPFEVFDGGYSGYSYGYGYRSNSGSPDSTEVREREGIPDLEEETENEVYKEALKGKRINGEAKKIGSVESTPAIRDMPVHKSIESISRTVPLHARTGPLHESESSSRSVPLHKNEGSSRTVPLHKSESTSRSVPLQKNKGSSRTGPLHKSESSPRSVPLHKNEGSKRTGPLHKSDGSSRAVPSFISSEESEKPSISPSSHFEGSVSSTEERSVDEGSVKKKNGAASEVECTSKQEIDSSRVSSVTMLSPHGTRDLREVVAEIRDDFENASSYGKEVAMILEVGKLPYQPGFLKVILSRIMYLLAPSPTLRDSSSMQSVKLASRSMSLAKSYFDGVGKDVNSKVCNLSSTLDKLYAWEKKLYKEVKDEERLRKLYEKQCKRLKMLDERGADSGKISATQAYIRRLLTKLDVSIKAIDVISNQIQKLRDEELQPKLAALIHGLRRMWKAMLKCHQKQFQAIMESKMRKLKANTGPQTDSSSRATTELEKELHAWCQHFNDWIGFQKSYVESLNGWLLQCLQYEQEETPDGPVPYSPGQLGAPPVFIICNDWQQAMQTISEGRVANSMNALATSLQQLWEKQDEEERQRVKAEYLTKDYEKLLRRKMEPGLDPDLDKTGFSVVPSGTGASHLDDDLKLNLNSLRQRLAEERIKHKDAMKLVRDAASRSLKGGLVPIFKALESFTSEALQAHEHVRLLRHPQQSS